MDSVGPLKKVAKGAGFVFVGMVFSKIISFFYRFFIARGLGPEGYGMIQIGISVVNFVFAFCTLGLTGGLSRFVAFYKGKKDSERIKGVIQITLLFTVPLSILAGIILFFFSPQIAPLVTSMPIISPEMTMILRLFSVVVPFVLLSTIFSITLESLQNIKHSVLSNYIIFNVVQLVLALLLFYLGFSVFGIAVAYVLSTIIATVSLFYYLNRSFPLFTKTKPKKPYREMFSYSLPFTITTIADRILKWADTLFVGVFRDAIQSGIYNAALPIASVLQIIQTGFSSIFSPLTIEMYAKDKMKQLDGFYKHVTNWIFYAGLPFFLVMFLFSRNIINFLFGPDYVSGYAALSVLTIGYFLNSLTTNSYSILYAMKKTKLVTINMISGAALDLVLNFALIPTYGMVGAAMAVIISMNLISMIGAIEVWHYARIQPFTTRIFRSLAAGAVSISFVYMITEVFWDNVPFYILIALFVLFLGLYSVLLLAFGTLQKHDIEILKSVENRIGFKNKKLRNFVKKFIKS
jgi:O-antigen/teichoic acid export membrane protein